MLQFGSLSILAVERKADGANVTSASDALWYTVVTISTVGYGDQFPVTNAGRLIGILIIVVGVGVFGTFTGYLANLFLGPSKSAESEETTDDVAPGTADSEAVAPRIASSLADETAERLRVLLAQSEETMAEIRRLLADSTS